MAGTSAAGLLAGCGGQAGNETDTPIQTETTLEIETQTGTDGPSCDLSTRTPTSSEGEFRMLHGLEEGRTRLIQGTATLFNQGEGNPTINLERATSDGFLDNLRNNIPAGQGPHLFLWAHDIAGEFVENDFLSDESDELRVEECVYTDPAWDAVNFDGQTIGLPYAAECPALIYNKDILSDMGVEPPAPGEEWSFDEWLSIMQDYNEGGSSQYGLAYPINAYFTSCFAQAYGEEIFNAEEDELGLETQELIDGVNIILNDLKPLMPSDPAYGAQMAVFQDGNAPFAINGPWTIAGLEDQDLNIGVTRIPAPEGATTRPYSGVQTVYFAKKMRQDNAASRAAREFAEWYTTRNERLLNLINNSSYIPVKSGLAGSDQLPEAVKGYAQQFETGYPMPQVPKMNAVWTPYETAVLEAFNTGNDVEPLLADAAEEIRSSDLWS